MENFLDTHVWSLLHWPFMAWAFFAMAIGQVMKSAVWTKARAHRKGRMQWFWWWGFKTLPIHPAIAGFFLGLIWTNPENADPVWPWIASAMYFGAAGALSVWLYQILKGLLKSRGIIIDPDSSAP